MNLQETLSQLITSTSEIFAAEAGFVALLEPMGNELVIRAAAGAGADTVLGLGLPVDAGVTGWVVAHKQPALILDAGSDRRFCGAFDTASGIQTRSILCAPLKTAEYTIGAIEVSNVGPDHLSEAGLKILTMIADHAALSIENAGLLAETTILREVAAAASTMDFKQVLNRTRNVLQRTLNIPQLNFILPNPPQELVTDPRYTGRLPAEDTVWHPLPDSAVAWTIRHRQPLLLSNVGKTSAHHDLAQTAQSKICVPIILKNKMMAILNVESPQPYALDAQDFKLCKVAAAGLVEALKNVRLFETKSQLVNQQRAMLDIFTDLSTKLEPELLFERIVKHAIAVIPNAEAGSLIVPKDDAFGYGAAVGFDFEALRQLRLTREDYDSYLNWMRGKSDKSPYIHRLTQADIQEINNALFQEYAARFETAGRLNEIQSNLRAILKVGQEILGTINVDSLTKANAFSQQDEQTLMLFANQAAIAIQNARLFQNTRSAEADYRDLFDNAYDLIFTVDSNFKITSANKVVYQTTGYTPNDLLGKRVFQFIYRKQIPGLYRFLKTHFTSQQPPRLEVNIFGKKQQKIVLDASIRIKRVNGRPVGLHCIARDITEQREMQHQLRHIERLSTIGKLVAGVAHELNNPLTSISGYARLLEADGLTAIDREDLQIIFRQAERARLIVQNLLTFARKMPLNARPVDINAVLQSSLMLTKQLLQSQKIELDSDLSAPLPLTFADSSQLEQVFVNLLTNAGQALAGRSGLKRITIDTAKTNNNTISIRIGDNGPGISDEIIHRIFDPFFSTKQVGKGTGLGLSLCFGIISEHNGKIWAENNPKGGATFNITLPVVSTESPVASAPKQILTPDFSVQPEIALMPPRPQGRQILAVDDEPYLLQLLQRILVKMEHKIDTVASGQEALRSIDKKSYDLIICDILLPDILGPELYKRATEKTPDLAKKFVFITGNAIESDTRIFLNQTGLLWLAKPFLPSDVQQIINQALAGTDLIS